MPNEPSDPKEPDEPSDPKDGPDLDWWIDRTPEPIESVIPQLQETVVEAPDTPRPTDEDREEAPNEGDAKTHDTEPPDHDSVMRSAFEHDDVGPGSRFGAEIMPLVPGGKDDITIRQELEQEDKDAARAAEQEDARDDIPWEPWPGPKVEMPDGTLLEVPDVDFEDVGPFWKTSMGRDMIRKALVIGGGVFGALGVLVVLFLLFNGGEADTQTLDTTAATTQETDATGTDGGESVEESEEPLSAVEPTETASTVSVSPEDLDAIAGSAGFSACPLGFQLDVIRLLLSGKDGEQSEHIPGSNVACTKFNKRNPDVFTMMVEGDGETLSTAENTSYQVRFVVNNEWPVNEYYDDTGFEVLVEWNSLAKQWVGVVRDQQGNRLGNDADVTIEWLDSSTLQVVVDVPDLDVEVTEMRTELNVYVTDDNDVRQYDNFDVAIWLRES
ncbi:MAG: hypothetical protein V3S26_06860 [Acidimicrobiia bacterium]